jgi:hypothetical protein
MARAGRNGSKVSANASYKQTIQGDCKGVTPREVWDGVQKVVQGVQQSCEGVEAETRY